MLVTCISKVINDVETLFLYMFSISVYIIVLCVVYICMFACVYMSVHIYIECGGLRLALGFFSCLFSTLYTKKSFSYLTLNSVIWPVKLGSLLLVLGFQEGPHAHPDFTWMLRI